MRTIAAMMTFAMLTSAGPACAQQANSTSPDLTVRVAALEAREDIRALLNAYGDTIDARDFDAFAELWASDAIYIGGATAAPVTGPQAIADFMEGVINANPFGYATPNAHIVFNETIIVNGDRASGTSMSAFVTPDADGAQVMRIVASYEDDYVREDGAWKFARRIVRPITN